MLKLKTNYGEYDVYPVVMEYKYGGVAIELVCADGEPFAMLTVSIDDSPFYAYGFAYVDTNNCPWAEDFIEEYGLGVKKDYYGHSGFCDYPLYFFDVEKINEIEYKTTGKRDYEVDIRAVVSRGITVKAKSPEEAEQIVREGYANGEYDDYDYWHWESEEITVFG